MPSLCFGVKDRANEIYKKVEDLKSIRGRSQDAILAACLYIACRQEDKPRTFKGSPLFQMLSLHNMPGSTLTGVIVVALCFGNGWGIIGKADNWAMLTASLLHPMGVLKKVTMCAILVLPHLFIFSQILHGNKMFEANLFSAEKYLGFFKCGYSRLFCGLCHG